METSILNADFSGTQEGAAWRGRNPDDPARVKLLNRIPFANDKREFLRRVKNSLYEYYKKEFGIFSEATGELMAEQLENEKLFLEYTKTQRK